MESTNENYGITVTDGALNMEKKDDAKINFDDGVFFHLDETE